MAVTYDTTATYVLYMVGHDVRVGKRTNAGAYTFRTVDTFTGPMFPYGDIIAANGFWFGVWTEQAGASQRLTWAGSALAVASVTTPPADTADTLPTLAYSGGIPVLVWTRVHSPAEPGPADLMVSKYLAPTWEVPRVFASAGHENFRPDMKIAAGKTFVTWTRDGRTVVASNHTGVFTSRSFATPGGSPTIGVSVTGSAVDHVFLSWTVFGPPNHVFFAETASTGSVTGTWEGATLGPPVNVSLATGGFATKGTTVYSGSNSVVARSQA